MDQEETNINGEFFEDSPDNSDEEADRVTFSYFLYP
jgi:hypothetical protein